MEKVKLLFIMLLLGSITTFAQKSKVSEATAALSSGKLDKAKESIDAAFNDPSVKTYAKAYLVKGQIYQGIAEDVTELFSGLDNNAAMIAYESYQKAREYDTKGKLSKKINKQMETLPLAFTRMGEKRFTAKDYEGAMQLFQKVIDMKKSINQIDTTMYFNVGLSAEKAEKYDIASDAYKKALEYGYKPDEMYARIASSLKLAGNVEESTKYLQEGFDKYPESESLLYGIINYYMASNETDKALKYLNKAIGMNPKNPSLYIAKATLYQKMKDYEKAKELLLKTTEIAPDNFSAKYNLAFLMSEKVTIRHKEVNEIMDNKLYNTEIKKVYQMYADIIPYFKDALALQPENFDLLNALKSIYFTLRNTDPEMMKKYEELNKQLGE